MGGWLWWIIGIVAVLLVIYIVSCRRYYRKHFYQAVLFNDSYFGPDTSQCNDISHSGWNMMRTSKVLICALARDVEPLLELFIYRITEFGKQWKDYRVIIFENDSSDKTPQILRGWQQTNPKVRAMTEKLKWPSAVKAGLQSAARFDKMAYCRNRCLKVVKEPEYDDFDYVLVTESDLKGGFSTRGVANSLGWQSALNWDAMIAYGVHLEGGLRFFYDPLAFKSSEGKRVRWFRPPQTPAEAKDMSWTKFFFMAKKNDRPFPVRSSGGGVWLYRRKSLKDVWYQGKDCEHIGLHEQMISQGHDRIYVNPSMLAVSGVQGLGQLKRKKKNKS